MTLGEAAKAGWQFESIFQTNVNDKKYLRAKTPQGKTVILYGTGDHKGLKHSTVRELATSPLTLMPTGDYAIGTPILIEFTNPFE